jgi:hypothetical protein
MEEQIKQLNFEGQNIYMDFDVHHKSWQVTLMSDVMTEENNHFCFSHLNSTLTD